MNKIGFISKMTRQRTIKKEIVQRARKSFDYGKTNTDKVNNSFTNIIGPTTALLGPIMLYKLPTTAGHGFMEAVVFGLAGIYRQIALNSHKSALKGAAEIGKKMKTDDFNSAERIIVTKDYLSQKGNKIFSTLFKIIYPNRVKQLSDGIETKSGFLNFSLKDMSKNWD